VPSGGPPFAVTEEERRFCFEDDGWDLERENWSAFRKRILAELDEALETYGQRLSELAREREWVERLDIRQTKSYKWLVLYQVKKLSPERIAEQTGEYGKDTSTILKAVEKAAALCGLTLRAPNKGRTRKS
jgi:hypothetical protein